MAEQDRLEAELLTPEELAADQAHAQALVDNLNHNALVSKGLPSPHSSKIPKP